MVVIRLARSGAKKRPFYNIVAADSRARREWKKDLASSVSPVSVQALRGRRVRACDARSHRIGWKPVPTIPIDLGGRCPRLSFNKLLCEGETPSQRSTIGKERLS